MVVVDETRAFAVVYLYTLFLKAGTFLPWSVLLPFPPPPTPLPLLLHFAKE